MRRCSVVCHNGVLDTKYMQRPRNETWKRKNFLEYISKNFKNQSRQQPTKCSGAVMTVVMTVGAWPAAPSELLDRVKRPVGFPAPCSDTSFPSSSDGPTVLFLRIALYLLYLISPTYTKLSFSQSFELALECVGRVSGKIGSAVSLPPP